MRIVDRTTGQRGYAVVTAGRWICAHGLYRSGVIPRGHAIVRMGDATRVLTPWQFAVRYARADEASGR